ncbi:MAG: amidohydrolase family protein [Polyangiaceae bacterium]
MKRRDLLRAAGAVGLSAFTVGEARAQDAATKPTAIVGATWWRPGEAPLKDAVIVMIGDRIGYAGDDASQAAGAQKIDAGGKVVTAGLTDLLTQLGLVEVALESGSRDDSHDDADPVRAAFLAADGYDPASTVIPIARQHGITSAGIVPSGGLVPGQSAWVDLAGATPTDSIARRQLALHVSLDGGRDKYDASSGASLLRLRELFDDARALKNNPGGYDRRQVRELGASRLDLIAVGDALDRRIPVVFEVDRASDIVGVLAFAKEQGIRAVLASAAEGWKVAAEIAAAKVPAIVHALDHGPRTFKARYAREDNAALLQKAGVTVALSATSTHMTRKLRQIAGNAIRAGLPASAAVDAVTRAPARIMGMDDHGELKKDQVANVALWSGDPFELSSKVERLFIRGEAASLRSRQTALLERYR